MKYTVLIKDIMNKDVKTVSIEDSIQKAAQTMKKNHIGSVIIMGEKNVKGILTAEDIVYKHVAAGEGKLVTDIMARDVVYITPEKTMEDASKLMIEKHVKKLPVLLQGNLVGIVTATDIMKIAPTLYTVLLEQLKIGKPEFGENPKGNQFVECEICGNFVDDVDEIDGVWICSDCNELTKSKKES